MNEYDEEELYGPDEDEIQSDHEITQFRDFMEICPNCKNEISSEHDSCPFCGDIIYRTLKDHTFAPKKGPMTKVFIWFVITLVTLGTIAMILSMIGLF